MCKEKEKEKEEKHFIRQYSLYGIFVSRKEAELKKRIKVVVVLSCDLSPEKSRF